MRLFLAVNLPDETRDAVFAAAAPMRAAAPGVAWVRPHLLHVTLKFLGETPEAAADGVRRAAEAVALGSAPFEVHLRGAGAFPNFRRPRVVWIGIEPAAPMARLAAGLDAACAALGFAREERPFAAHLTLGRVKRELGRGEGVALERAGGAVALEVGVAVRSIDVMRSELSAQGPTYTRLARAALGGAA
jgi:2'-5' RNA ligase